MFKERNWWNGQDIHDAEMALEAAKKRKLELIKDKNNDDERQARISETIVSQLFGQ